MINLFDKSRSPFPKDEILTQTFLINKIADEMKMKYKKVFSVINYDELSLKNDIHKLLSKYISSKKKEINIKFIETTILNKVREKYKVIKRSLNPINKNNQKSLIKIIYSIPTNPNNINSYLNLNQNHKTISAKKNVKNVKNLKNLSPIKTSLLKKNDSAENLNIDHEKSDNNISNNIIEVNENNNENGYENNQSNENREITPMEQKDKSEINNAINEKSNDVIQEINNDEDIIKKNIQEEQEEIKALEKYKEEIQNEINNIDKVMKKQDKIKNLKNNLINDYNNNEYDKIQQSLNERYNLNNSNNLYNNENNNNDDEDNVYPKMTREQKQYLEIKKRIEEDFHNKQNRYIFLKPKKYNEKEEENNLNNGNKKNIFQYDNYRINKYSVDKLNEYYKIKEKIKQEKEKQLQNNKSTRDLYKQRLMEEEKKKINIKKQEINSMPLEDKIQLKILQRSLDQQKAIEHLRNILYPQKQLLAESEYQGFDSNRNEKNEIKQRECELADEARKIQIEKMKMLLDSSIGDKKMKKLEEKEIEKKYRQLLDKEHEIFLQKEKQKKNDQAAKIENYRKMLDEQIQAKKQIMLDENNISEINKELISIE